MLKNSLVIFVLLALIAGTAHSEPDSLWVGRNYAYQVTDSTFKVPLYYSSEHVLRGIGFPVKFITTGGPIYPDSVTRAGRSYGLTCFEIFLGVTSGDHGGNPDSTCVGMIGLSEIPAGDGIIAELWFTGGQIGDLISFLPIENYPPACQIGSDPYDPEGGPYHIATAVQLVAGQTEIVCQSVVDGMATHTISFPINVYGPDGPFSLELLSFTGPTEWDHEPYLSGDNPWTFNWVPGFNDVGQFAATLRATDGLGETVDEVVTINVSSLEIDPCDVARGDLNCDNKVDIADLVHMVDWMFNDGPAPYCK